jgi:hypothetical protein
MYPIARSQEDLILGANNAVRHMTTDIRQGANDGQRNHARTANKGRRCDPGHGIFGKCTQRVVIYLRPYARNLSVRGE